MDLANNTNQTKQDEQKQDDDLVQDNETVLESYLTIIENNSADVTISDVEAEQIVILWDSILIQSTIFLYSDVDNMYNSLEGLSKVDILIIKEKYGLRKACTLGFCGDLESLDTAMLHFSQQMWDGGNFWPFGGEHYVSDLMVLLDTSEIV